MHKQIADRLLSYVPHYGTATTTSAEEYRYWADLYMRQAKSVLDIAISMDVAGPAETEHRDNLFNQALACELAANILNKRISDMV